MHRYEKKMQTYDDIHDMSYTWTIKHWLSRSQKCSALGSKQKQVGNTKEAIIQKLVYVHKKVIYGIVCDVEILEAFENIIKLMENLIIVQSRQ